MRKQKKSLAYEELAVLAANGDDESMALLISAITPIATAKGYAHANSRVAGDDLTQEGMLGFLEAVRSFNPEKGSFKAYAETCINNRILSAVRASYNNKNAALSKALPLEEGADEISGDESDPVKIVSSMDGFEYITGLIKSSLSDLERQVIILRFFGFSYAEISAKLACSEKAVDNALQRSRKKIQEKLNKDDNTPE
ncbi:MAG: sigma-70 family RNA polymerase sigma factor [Clostridia bacterium]|nr:sigma-70 family RNA polymerase sigma factor [Clostridia bacterium]